MVIFRVALPVICLLLLLATSPTAAPTYSDWSPPAPLNTVNSPANDAGPAISKKGTTLYFNSNRSGNSDIWVSQRDSVDDDWGTPVNLAIVNSAGIDAIPSLSRDEHWLFFQSNRFPSRGLDLWASYREDVHDDFAWGPPGNLGDDVNSSAEDTNGGYFENEDGGVPQLFFASNRLGGFDLYVSELQPNGTFGPAQLIPELNSPFADPGMMVRADGLEAFIYSTRTAGSHGMTDIWTSTRDNVFEPWSPAVNAGPLLNSARIDQRPYVSSDRRTLYFASDRSGVSGLDLYQSTRTKH